jgi:ketosteroid isomerase-like protein
MGAAVPAEIHRECELAFNAGDLEALVALYEPDAALIAQPGTVARGAD